MATRQHNKFQTTKIRDALSGSISNVFRQDPHHRPFNQPKEVFSCLCRGFFPVCVTQNVLKLGVYILRKLKTEENDLLLS